MNIYCLILVTLVQLLWVEYIFEPKLGSTVPFCSIQVKFSDPSTSPVNFINVESGINVCDGNGTIYYLHGTEQLTKTQLSYTLTI